MRRIRNDHGLSIPHHYQQMADWAIPLIKKQ